MAVLGRISDPRAATPLAEKAKSPQWRTRAAAAAGMGAQRSEDTRLVLEQLLRDDDEDVRRTALMALRYRGETDSAEAISNLLGDPVFANRFAAADALVGLGVPVPQHVFSLVGSGQPEVRHLSLETCGRLGSKRSYPMLANLLASEDWGVRAFAAEALCRIGDPRACGALQELLGRESNGLVLAKTRGAMKATRLCLREQLGVK
jgi:HEAT repeat protein